MNACDPETQNCCPLTGGAVDCITVIDDLNNCGDCGNICAITDDACCDGQCVVLGTFDNCDIDCNPCITGDGCCPLIGADPTLHRSICVDTTINRNYCTVDCIDCTADPMVITPYCCDEVDAIIGCHDIVNTDLDCGCGFVCNGVNETCCAVVNTTNGINACTGVYTQHNCGDCGIDCDDLGVDDYGREPWSACCNIPEALPTDPFTDQWKCINVRNDISHCGKCGRKCGDMEICCDGECQLNTTNDNCGGCAVWSTIDFECTSSTTCCVVASDWACRPFENVDTACGCTGNVVNCTDTTLFPPPDENHDNQYTCCRGNCVPKWYDCVD